MNKRAMGRLEWDQGQKLLHSSSILSPGCCSIEVVSLPFRKACKYGYCCCVATDEL